jgi:hypothetical protein
MQAKRRRTMVVVLRTRPAMWLRSSAGPPYGFVAKMCTVRLRELSATQRPSGAASTDSTTACVRPRRRS